LQAQNSYYVFTALQDASGNVVEESLWTEREMRDTLTCSSIDAKIRARAGIQTNPDILGIVTVVPCEQA
jgi:hypothetical protein